MKLRLYIAPQQGTGSRFDPYRSIVNDLIDVNAGESFNEIDYPARRYSLVLVMAEDTTHQVIAADSNVTLVSRLYDDRQALKDDLDSDISSFPSVFVQELNTKLEAGGISTSWISSSNTLRDVIRYLIRVCFISQICYGEVNSNMLDFLRQNLDARVFQIPPAVRQPVKDWMQLRGMAIGWIDNQTTVREIVHFIVMNLGFGLINFDGEGY